MTTGLKSPPINSYNTQKKFFHLSLPNQTTSQETLIQLCSQNDEEKQQKLFQDVYARLRKTKKKIFSYNYNS